MWGCCPRYQHCLPGRQCCSPGKPGGPFACLSTCLTWYLDCLTDLLGKSLPSRGKVNACLGGWGAAGLPPSSWERELLACQLPGRPGKPDCLPPNCFLPMEEDESLPDCLPELICLLPQREGEHLPGEWLPDCLPEINCSLPRGKVSTCLESNYLTACLRGIASFPKGKESACLPAWLGGLCH